MAAAFVAEAWAGVRAALLESAPFVALIPASRIGDRLPDKAPYPFLRFDSGSSVPFRDQGKEVSIDGAIVTLTLNIFTQSDQGKLQASRIADAFAIALDRASLPNPPNFTGRLTNPRVEAGQIVDGVDGNDRYQQASMTVRVMTHA